MDPHWFNADPDPDPAFFLIADPDTEPDSVPNPEIEKFTTVKLFILFFGAKIAIYLSLDLHKGRISYRRIPQHFKTGKFFTFLYSWVIFPLLAPDPDTATQFNEDPCGSGSESGSTTLINWIVLSEYTSLHVIVVLFTEHTMNEFIIQIDKILKNHPLPRHNIAADRELPEDLPQELWTDERVSWF